MVMKIILLPFLLMCSSFWAFSQQTNNITVVNEAGQKRVIVKANGLPFTEFVYRDTLEKPFLYPLYAADEQIVTRGFPLSPRFGDPTDHPHHTGLWLNYESVNGIDFWNNSYAIPENKKNMYGWIRTTGITQTISGVQGVLKYEAVWTGLQKNVLLKEKTTFIFSATSTERIIDRITTLTAQLALSFKDAKDGFFGMRVAHELELPSKDERQFVDEKGNITSVPASNNQMVTGNYLTSQGKSGDSAWGTRGRWCMLFGKMGGDSISIVIIDHPKNPGYPTYWHARGYGLFAANPLGQKIFSNGKEELNFTMKENESVVFRYRVVIFSAKKRVPIDEIERLAEDFAH
jgi:Methane oxygenase PmoA